MMRSVYSINKDLAKATYCVKSCWDMKRVRELEEEKREAEEEEEYEQRKRDEEDKRQQEIEDERERQQYFRDHLLDDM